VRRIGSIGVALLVSGGTLWAEAQNLFEWSAVAPIVVDFGKQEAKFSVED